MPTWMRSLYEYARPLARPDVGGWGGEGRQGHLQKPVSLTIAEGRALIHAVHQIGHIFQIGSQ